MTIDWDVLRKQIQGTVLSQSDKQFESHKAALVWNELKPNRSPEVIVTVKNDHDVVAAVNFARENELKIVMRGGGHTWCGLAVRNGGMTIDLSQLNDSSIDKKTNTAFIQPVISNQDLARRLGKYELAFPIDHCPTVKASGYLLSGGMSWNLSQWGPACRSVIAIDLVTADGEKITASATEHPDLFWAVRGCGPGMFAVATGFHLNCYPLPQAMMTSTYFYSLDDLKNVAEEVTALGWQMPNFVELSIFLIQAPKNLVDQCKHTNGKLCMISAVAFANTNEEGITALSILERGKATHKCLAKKLNERSSFEQLSEISGATWPEGHRNLCENQCSKAKPVDILMALQDKIIDALSMDGSSYGGSWAIWEKPEDDIANKKWQDAVLSILKPFTSTHYIGETDFAQHQSRLMRSFTAEKWKKLEEIRGKYDPEGLFFGYLGGISS